MVKERMTFLSSSERKKHLLQQQNEGHHKPPDKTSLRCVLSQENQEGMNTGSKFMKTTAATTDAFLPFNDISYLKPFKIKGILPKYQVTNGPRIFGIFRSTQGEGFLSIRVLL